MTFGPTHEQSIRLAELRRQMSARYLMTEGQLHDVPDLRKLDAERISTGPFRVRLVQSGAGCFRQIKNTLTGRFVSKVQKVQR